jgi:galactokinase
MSDRIIFTRAPGRVNLIGEHTDYQMGYVMPSCINLEISLWAKKRTDNNFKVYSKTINEKDVFHTNNISKSLGWKNYHRGIIKAFNEIIPLKKGYNIWIDSNLPRGSGLSSSAALEMAILSTLEKSNGISLSDIDAIKLCWEAENNFVGLSCGIMDQFIVRMGKKNHAILLNCKTFEYEQAHIPDSVELLIVDTNVKRKLTESAYNQRVKECNIAIQQLNEAGLSIKYISDINIDDFEQYGKNVEYPYYRRAKHIITENERVIKLKNKLKEQNLQEIRKILYEAHDSIKNDYEASWKRADELVEYTKTLKGCYGARMTGAGWGGSCVVLVDKNNKEVKNRIEDWFMKKYHESIIIHHIKTSDGVSSIFTSSTPRKEINNFLDS